MIQLQKFLKIYGSDNIQFVLESDNPEDSYTGLEIAKIKKVSGFGVPITDKLWEVFSSEKDAEKFEDQMRGTLTTSNYILSHNGIRERVEIYA
jgi:hypothetical protein